MEKTKPKGRTKHMLKEQLIGDGNPYSFNCGTLDSYHLCGVMKAKIFQFKGRFPLCGKPNGDLSCGLSAFLQCILRQIKDKYLKFSQLGSHPPIMRSHLKIAPTSLVAYDIQ
eukprot:TRINITY_DN9218_c0_g1_i1.p2 TRINITY_DN9218_c0_g1~~TRINITY_DN9218_c0_g1_i1.p2  ORF type:complete len:112 (-),score=9.83 TRINITY_DN9218_c0_g1_i1:131-466(-)